MKPHPPFFSTWMIFPLYLLSSAGIPYFFEFLKSPSDTLVPYAITWLRSEFFTLTAAYSISVK